MTTSSFVKSAVVLGLLAAAGPFAIDMYLPALPTISEDLSASTAATQMTLFVFFVTFGVGQLFYGPISDMVGRKPPLYVGGAIFILGGIGCALAPTVEWLIVFRVVQGIGAAAGMVIPRAIVRDMHTGPEATKLMALVMLVISISPLLAPILGSILIEPFGWRSVFIAVTLVAIIGGALFAALQPETRPPEDRVPIKLSSLLAGFGGLFLHWRFLGLTFIGGFGFASFFAFLASSSFIYIEHFGLTQLEYGFAFSLNAVGFFAMSQLAGFLSQRFGMERTIRTAVGGYAFFSVALLVVTLAGFDGLVVLMVFLFLAFACLGLVIPTTMVLALDDHGPVAGMASALGGTLQMVFGALMIVVVSEVFDGTAIPMVIAIGFCGAAAFVLALLTLGRSSHVPEPSG